MHCREYEALAEKKPCLDYIKVFGCIGHMKIPSIHLKKLDDSSKQVIYLGKEPGIKAFRVYDPNAGSVHVSRDMVFEEDKSWMWNFMENRRVYDMGSFVLTDINSGIAAEDHAQDNQPPTPVSSSGEQSADTPSTDHTESDLDNSSGSSEPRRFRLLSDVYNEIEEVKLEDELLLLSIDEPDCYSQAAEKKKESGGQLCNRKWIP